VSSPPWNTLRRGCLVLGLEDRAGKPAQAARRERGRETWEATNLEAVDEDEEQSLFHRHRMRMSRDSRFEIRPLVLFIAEVNTVSQTVRWRAASVVTNQLLRKLRKIRRYVDT
jgi:hypothetical protein